MSVCKLGSACLISLWGTEPDLGPVAITTMGTNHDCGPVVQQGQRRDRVNAGLRLAAAVNCFGMGVVDQGLAAPTVAQAAAQAAAALAVGSSGGSGLA